jgi:hypothetical protein
LSCSLATVVSFCSALLAFREYVAIVYSTTDRRLNGISNGQTNERNCHILRECQAKIFNQFSKTSTKLHLFYRMVKNLIKGHIRPETAVMEQNKEPTIMK